ncbi:MAG: type II toxin-antitoxin system RelE/ParE family toxin [Alphaproteobacteria bacterium]|nr:type II toxin-antitoxin system RelE/ParE family toxin [Alphaproteobacteria bacterium]MBU2417159.1 type II toxin-antitoxin system RelE/ParE family toxin [Alphaproteobacteria bacterium]
MRPRLTRAAEEDVIHVYLESARLFGRLQADRYLDGLECAFDFVAHHPLAARERQEINPPVRIHAYGAHIIVYLVEPDGVLILRIRHGRENWQD